MIRFSRVVGVILVLIWSMLWSRPLFSGYVAFTLALACAIISTAGASGGGLSLAPSLATVTPIETPGFQASSLNSTVYVLLSIWGLVTTRRMVLCS